MANRGTVLVVSAHAGNSVWRADGALTAAGRGDRAVVVCLSYGERGKSASPWLARKSLDEVRAVRHSEAEAAATLGAEIEFLDAGDYPLIRNRELLDEQVRIYRRVQPTVVLTHSLLDPYNADHPAAAMLVQVKRNAGSILGLPVDTKGEAYMRYYPQVTKVLE